MRRVALLALGLAGCNQVLGLDPLSGRDGGAADAIESPIDALDAVDAEPCTGTTTCFPDNHANAPTACSDQAISTCGADDRFAYCNCGDQPLADRVVFAVPALANPEHTDLILVAEPGLQNLEVLMVGCYGPAAPACNLDQGPCAGSGRALYMWRDLPRGPGSYDVTVFVDDVGFPCTTNDGGTVLAQVAVTR